MRQLLHEERTDWTNTHSEHVDPLTGEAAYLSSDSRVKTVQSQAAKYLGFLSFAVSPE